MMACKTVTNSLRNSQDLVVNYFDMLIILRALTIYQVWLAGPVSLWKWYAWICFSINCLHSRSEGRIQKMQEFLLVKLTAYSATIENQVTKLLCAVVFCFTDGGGGVSSFKLHRYVQVKRFLSQKGFWSDEGCFAY